MLIANNFVSLNGNYTTWLTWAEHCFCCCLNLFPFLVGGNDPSYILSTKLVNVSLYRPCVNILKELAGR